MANVKQPKKQVKDKFLIARVTAKDYDVLAKTAKKAGMSLGEWLRNAAWEKHFEGATAI